MRSVLRPATSREAPGPPRGQFSGTSALNFVAGQTIPNLAVSPVDASGQIHIFNFARTADVIVDILGWY